LTFADIATPSSAVAAWKQTWRLAGSHLGKLLLFALGIAIIWWPPRPAMVDLAQHAGQIALLRDILLGHSPWAHQIRINLLTPYLIGYGLALPLSLVMPVLTAMKVLLTVAYGAFAGLCLAIRRELDAAPQLDAYFFVSFFGFAYGWGMYTFLVAAPVGLAYLLLSIRYARNASVVRGIALTALGLALLFSHGLVFLLAWSLGVGFLTLAAGDLRGRLARAWPFVAPLLICAALFIIINERETAISTGFATKLKMGGLGERLLLFTTGGLGVVQSLWLAPCFVIMGLLPFLAGLKVDLRRKESLLIAAAVVGVLAVGPMLAWSTLFVYPRFALFLPPAYAWLFSPSVSRGANSVDVRASRLNVATLTVCGFVLASTLAWIIHFTRETPDFDAILARAKPGQRALALVIDTYSSAGVNDRVYMHFPLWYQAEKQGLVDFNFAFFHPEIARFANRSFTLIDDEFDWHPERFSWRREGGERYRYFFVRHTWSLPATLFAGADCAPVKVAEKGAWELFERVPCAPTITPRTSTGTPSPPGPLGASPQPARAVVSDSEVVG
jgi:hypothetical protein